MKPKWKCYEDTLSSEERKDLRLKLIGFWNHVLKNCPNHNGLARQQLEKFMR